MQERWSEIKFTMTPYKQIGSEEEIPLLGIDEDDFELLENDQLVIQGMLASRYLSQFKVEVNDWHKALFNVNEVFLLISDIQRTWSYLEPLFIHSDEVKRELPEDATRFASIDKSVQSCLKRAWKVQLVKDAFNEDGLNDKLEFIQEQLDLCKKSLRAWLTSWMVAGGNFHVTTSSVKLIYWIFYQMEVLQRKFLLMCPKFTSRQKRWCFLMLKGPQLTVQLQLHLSLE